MRPDPLHGLLTACLFVGAAMGCSGDDGATAPAAEDDPQEAFSGGPATVFDVTRDAYAQIAPVIHGEREDDFFVGNAIFNRGWATAPASVPDFDGLGPLFNATNCSACHLKDGRGRPPVGPDESFLGLLLRLSVPGESEHGGPVPEPTYGGQVQGSAVLGVPPEGREKVVYVEQPGAFPDGEAYSLRAPTYSVEDLGYGPMAPDTLISPRVAPGVFGLGLLELVPEEEIVARADPDDANGDGVSGRPNRVFDVRRGGLALGRFGWKANQPSLEQQAAGAFNGDVGITSSLFPVGDCTAEQAACLGAPSGGSPELGDALLASVVAYSHLLAVPARRDWATPTVRRGKTLFTTFGCTRCHTPTLHTGPSGTYPELAHATIRPYTDLLLHDMGPGLADGRPDFQATGAEWRTPPLWGMGLLHTVNKHTFLLHDGRARDAREAILWHDGEGRAARDAFAAAAKPDRDALLAFLESL